MNRGMAKYHQQVSGTNYSFDGLVDLMAKATPLRSGDELAGCAASSDAERAAAQWVLADLPLTVFLEDLVVPYEDDEVTRLIVDSHDRLAFAPVAHLTVGGLRDWLLETASAPEASARLSAVSPGLTPEMVAAVSKIMRNQDLIAVAKAITVTAGFRTTIGLPGRLSTRLQPNHPTDDPRGIAAATLDGLLMGCGDAVIGINPATDSPQATSDLLHLLDDIRQRFEIPTQSCVLSHVTTTIGLIESGVPVDLVFQSIAGTEGANSGFGVNIPLLREGNEAGRSLNRGTVGNNVMYLETGQGSASVQGRTTAPAEPRSISRHSRPGHTQWHVISNRYWSTRWSASSVPSIFTTASRSFARAWRITSAENSSGCRWEWTSATPTTPKPIKTTWTTCSPCWASPARRS